MAGFTQEHGALVSDVADIEGYAQVNVAVSASVAVTASALPEGKYQVSCEEATVYLAIDAVSATADNVTVATGFPLLAGNAVTLLVREARFLAGITAAAAGTLRIHKIG